MGIRPNNLPIECGDGWLDIIMNCHAKLLEIDPDYTPVQIKEKFGTLRYYFVPSQRALSAKYNEKFDKMCVVVDFYEKKSFSTCEYCGDKGTQHNINRWIKTLCETHYQEKINARHNR